MSKVLSFLSLLALPALGLAVSPPSVGLPPTIPLSAASSSPSLYVQFTGGGLTSLQWNGTEMLASGAPIISWISLIQPDGSWSTGDTNCTTTVDVANRVLTQKFAWGSISYAYTTTQTQLFADVTIQNTSTTPVGMFIMQLAELKFPQTPTEYDGSDPMVAWNMGDRKSVV